MLEMIWLGGLTALTDDWLIDWQRAYKWRPAEPNYMSASADRLFCRHTLYTLLFIIQPKRLTDAVVCLGRTCSWRARARAATSTNGKRNETPWTSYLRVFRWTSRADRGRKTSHSLSWFTGAREQTLFITLNVNMTTNASGMTSRPTCHVIV